MKFIDLKECKETPRDLKEYGEYKANLSDLKTWTHVLELALLAPEDEITFAGREALATFAGDVARLARLVEVQALGPALRTHAAQRKCEV